MHMPDNQLILTHEKKVLFAFPSASDPYYCTINNEMGPILTCLTNNTFQKIVFFLIPQLSPNIELLKKELLGFSNEFSYDIIDCSDCNATLLSESMHRLRTHISREQKKYADYHITLCWSGIQAPVFFICLSGMISSGELPCSLFVVQPCEFDNTFSTVDIYKGLMGDMPDAVFSWQNFITSNEKKLFFKRLASSSKKNAKCS